MKKLFINFSFFLVLFFSACADNKEDNDKVSNKSDDKELAISDVPAAVKSAFNSKYPGATDVKWETAKEDENPTYKAKCKMNGKKIKAEFGTDGTFIKEKDD